MQFPYTFFEDEVREGFYISGSMKRAWAAELEVLEEIDKVCVRHGIRWFADCGTLLGAVRHGGYIPWDDDLDICMLRDDYVRFNEVAARELPDGYILQNMHQKEPLYNFLTHVACGEHVMVDKDHLEKYHDCPYSLGVDIFPIDYLAADSEMEKQRKVIAKTLAEAAEAIPENLFFGGEKQADGFPGAGETDRNGYLNTARELLTLLGRELTAEKSVKQQVYEAAEEAFMMFPSERAESCALMFYWVFCDNHVYPRSLFDHTVMLPFENGRIQAPAAYDAVLRIEYGDYMKVVKGKSVHGYPNYCMQEDFLIRKEAFPFLYKFQPEDLLTHREPERVVKRESRAFLELVREAHRVIFAMAADGQTENCRLLLASCQESAICVGTLIEKEYGEGCETVKPLEKYCEVLYEVTNLLEETCTEKNMQSIATGFDRIYDEMETALEEGVLKRKEIVFLPFRVCYWDMMEPIWRQYMDDPMCDVVVIPIPYLERDAAGAARAIHYETTYPDYVQIVSYREYDMHKRHPDVIVIQNPYDESNFTTSVHPDYYAARLRPRTEELVYIPYFLTDDFGAEDTLANYTMRYFAKVPGVVCADCVVVQSENMRQRYIECLTEFAGETTKPVWESKVCISEKWASEALALCGQHMRQSVYSKLPDAWREKIDLPGEGRKKILLCGTETALLVQEGKAVVDKLRRAWRKVREYSEELVLIWHVQPEVYAVLERGYPELCREFERLRQEYINLDFGIYDDIFDSEEAVGLCDAYYGDPGYMAHACATQNKLVMLMDVHI